ncbi:MAG TPA: DUF167 domain-containing protein [Ktedonobacterales bacterium]|nr:DUF167 domain-containing protein [Ktedonobacterales bacterium]
MRSSGEDAGAEGTLRVTVRVVPRASRDELAREGDLLRARLTAPPVEGAANAALVALLSERLRIPKRAVTVTRGARSREKLLAIAGLTAAEFWRRLGL